VFAQFYAKITLQVCRNRAESVPLCYCWLESIGAKTMIEADGTSTTRPPTPGEVAKKASDKVIRSLRNRLRDSGSDLSVDFISRCLKTCRFNPRKLNPDKVDVYFDRVLKVMGAQAEKDRKAALAAMPNDFRFDDSRDSAAKCESEDDKKPLALKEKAIQSWLQKQLGGVIEQKTRHGFIDLLTDDVVFEIKKASEWKHALGQVIAYGCDYPAKRKALVLFDSSSFFNNELIADVCASVNVEVFAVFHILGTQHFTLYQICVSKRFNAVDKNGQTQNLHTSEEINERIKVSAVDVFQNRTNTNQGQRALSATHTTLVEDFFTQNHSNVGILSDSL